jgi:uncharacterized protein YbjT (DUF2867 family)
MPSLFRWRSLPTLVAAITVTISLACPSLAVDRPRVVVAGATGQSGIHVVRQLAAKGYAVRGLVRDAAKAREQHGDIAEWIAGDARDPQTLGPAFAGIRYAVSAIGSREREGPNSFEHVDWHGNRNLIDAARAAGIAHYILMTSGSAGLGDWDDPQVKRFGAGRLWKAKAEEHLRRSGLSYTIVAPGGLRDYAGGEKGVLLKPRNEYTVGVISRADVAAVIVECLVNPGCARKTVTVVNTDTAPPLAWVEDLARLPVDTAETIKARAAAD